MDAVAGEGAFEFASVSEVDGNSGGGADGLPVQDVVFAEILGYLGVGIKGDAEKPAVGAAKFFI